MKGVHESILECVGNTPLVRLHKMTAGMPHNVWAKLEFLNPAGSMKDRVGLKRQFASRPGCETLGVAILCRKVE